MMAMWTWSSEEFFCKVISPSAVNNQLQRPLASIYTSFGGAEMPVSDLQQNQTLNNSNEKNLTGISQRGEEYLSHRNVMKPGAADRFVGDVSSQVIP